MSKEEIKLPPLPDGVAFFAEYGGDVYTAETVERLRREAVEADRAERQGEAAAQRSDAEKLASAIIEAATRAGIVNSGLSFSGPQLLMLLEDLAKSAAPQAPAHKPLFAEMIAQHPGLAEELKAIGEAP